MHRVSPGPDQFFRSYNGVGLPRQKADTIRFQLMPGTEAECTDSVPTQHRKKKWPTSVRQGDAGGSCSARGGPQALSSKPTLEVAYTMYVKPPTEGQGQGWTIHAILLRLQ